MGKSTKDWDEEARKHKEDNPDGKGLVRDRGCTDCLCCAIFLAFIVATVGISAMGFKQGDPAKLLTPFDSDGNQCGVSAGYEDYPIKYFDSLPEPGAVCVSECPDALASVDCVVREGFDDCGRATYATERFMTLCLPDRESAAAVAEELLTQIDSQTDASKYLAELSICYPALIGMAFGTIVIAVVYIFLLKWLTKPILYTSMLLIFVLFVLLGGFCYL